MKMEKMVRLGRKITEIIVASTTNSKPCWENLSTIPIMEEKKNQNMKISDKTLLFI